MDLIQSNTRRRFTFLIIDEDNLTLFNESKLGVRLLRMVGAR